MPNLWSSIGFLLLLVHGLIMVVLQFVKAESIDAKLPSVLKGRLPIVSIVLLVTATAFIGKSLFGGKRPSSSKKPRRAKVDDDEDDE